MALSRPLPNDPFMDHSIPIYDGNRLHYNNLRVRKGTFLSELRALAFRTPCFQNLVHRFSQQFLNQQYLDDTGPARLSHQYRLPTHSDTHLQPSFNGRRDPTILPNEIMGLITLAFAHGISARYLRDRLR